jgi:tRNA-(ms[2]io[6]A)-hydroxylase
MLGLHYETPKAWAEQALERPDRLLLDHYFCELKAAAMARRTLRVHGKRHPSLKQLMDALAAGETEHAERVEAFLRERYPWPRAEKGGNAYVQGLRKLGHQQGQGRFLDQLLVCSLIEARSAERFKLLADAARGDTLGAFYADLYASEVNHYVLFVKLATEFFPQDEALRRLETLRAGEAALLRGLPAGARVHSGPVAAGQELA